MLRLVPLRPVPFRLVSLRFLTAAIFRISLRSSPIPSAGIRKLTPEYIGIFEKIDSSIIHSKEKKIQNIKRGDKREVELYV